MHKLKKYSPNLASGNVAKIDAISREYHGYGWDGQLTGQQELFDDFDDKGTCSPFLCEGCSRSKSPRPGREQAEQAAYEQVAIW